MHTVTEIEKLLGFVMLVFMMVPRLAGIFF